MERARFSDSRPTVGSILNAAFELYGRQARGAWSIAAITAIPAQVLIWIMVRVSLPSDAQARHGDIYGHGGVALPTVAITLLGFLAGALALAALSRLLIQGYTRRQTSWDESLAFASTHFATVLVLSVTMLAGLILGFALFLVPGIFLAGAWAAALPALMFERVKPLDALRRSFELVRGIWFEVFGVLVICLLIIVGVSFLIDLALTGPQSSSSIDVILTLQGIARALAAILTYPLLAAISVVIYAELRAYKEGVHPESLMPGPAAA
ncbi:MAG: hypothetical protein ACJ764_02015 [Solirubrobacteraceae bacterium]